MQKNLFKMKHTLTLLLLLVHVIAFAQSEENYSKWSYGIEYSRDNIKIPGIRSRIQTICYPSGVCIQNRFDAQNYTLGLQFAYSMHEKFKLETALLYSNKDNNEYSLIKKRYLTIPISINFTAFSIGKFKAFARGGTKFNFKVEGGNSYSQQNDDFFSEVFFGASLSYQVLKNLNVEAGYNYHLLGSLLVNPTDDKYTNRKTHGCFIRLNKKFKRKPKPEADVL